MESKIQYLSWERPLLPMVAEQLVEEYLQDGLCDIRDLTVVLPVARAGRRLLELLVESVEEHGGALIPPKMVTIGRLPELLYRNDAPRIAQTVRSLTWVRALEALENDELSRISMSTPETFGEKLRLAEEIDGKYIELNGEALTFSDIAELGTQLETFNEEERWQTLQKVADIFLRETHQLSVADIHACRKEALQESFVFEGTLILVGVAELPGIAKALLANAEGDMRAYVHAPDIHAEGFDQFGCIKANYWIKREIPILSESISVVSSFRDQAQAMSCELSRIADEFSANEISIGITDQALVPFVKEELELKNVVTREATGSPLHWNELYQFLSCVADYLRKRSYVSFGTLCRHPQMLNHLTRIGESQERILHALDAYHMDHIQAVIPLNEPVPGTSSSQKIVNALVQEVDDCLRDLAQSKLDLSGFANVLSELVIRVYGEKNLCKSDNTERMLRDTSKLLRSILVEFRKVPLNLQFDCEAVSALELVLSRLASSRLAQAPAKDVVEILGWLEVPLDDAPALLVLGCNEGLLPESVSSDSFLPNSLRSKVGLIDNDKRFARDIYHLNSIVHSRDRVHFIAGQVNQAGDSLLPSRLFYACEQGELARRVNQYFGQSPSRFVAETPAKVSLHNHFCAKRPAPLAEPISQMSVSAFKDYLACPYRFYLRHVLSLEEIDDASMEMDPRVFGIVAHQVVQDFGKSDIKSSSDKEEIANFLVQRSRALFQNRFQHSVMPAVKLQMSQLEKRLELFAHWQANWSHQGWEIEEVEYPLPEASSQIELDSGEHMLVRGRIDRIDRHKESGEWAVIDYKTFEVGKKPEDVHRNREGWIDLQLPLYEHLLRNAGFSGSMLLGYIPLSANLDDIHFTPAKWSEEELRDALRVAKEISASVRDQIFWPPKKVKFDSYSVLFGASGDEYALEGG